MGGIGSKQCGYCKKAATLVCPKCGLNVCGDHAEMFCCSPWRVPMAGTCRPLLLKRLKRFERHHFMQQKFETCPRWTANSSAIDNTALLRSKIVKPFVFGFESLVG